MAYTKTARIVITALLTSLLASTPTGAAQSSPESSTVQSSTVQSSTVQSSTVQSSTVEGNVTVMVTITVTISAAPTLLLGSDPVPAPTTPAVTPMVTPLPSGPAIAVPAPVIPSTAPLPAWPSDGWGPWHAATGIEEAAGLSGAEAYLQGLAGLWMVEGVEQAGRAAPIWNAGALASRFAARFPQHAPVMRWGSGMFDVALQGQTMRGVCRFTGQAHVELDLQTLRTRTRGECPTL